MWQQRKKKLLRLTERLHFGELNQLNGCGRAERKAGCVRRLKSSQENASVSLAKAESFFPLSFLYWWSSDPSLSLSHFSKSIFSLKCSALSQSSAFSSLCLFFLYFWSNHFQLFCFYFDFHLPFSQSLYRRHTDTQPVRPRWEKTGPRYKVRCGSSGVKAEM